MASIRSSGAILPSSSFLVDCLLRTLDFDSATCIVELGAGNGCVTREILRRMRADARLVCIEINPVFVELCSRISDPRLSLVQASATDLSTILAREGLETVDAVVSSLPLSIMAKIDVETILDAASQCVGANGRFIQYQYSLEHRAALSRRYRSVSLAFALLNVPPAFVYSCSHSALKGVTRHRIRSSFGSLYGAAIAAVGFAIRALQQIDLF
jgi:phospholipid N-methyltransferase